MRFLWKNPGFLLNNPDFLLNNPDFQLKHVDSMIKTSSNELYQIASEPACEVPDVNVTSGVAVVYLLREICRGSESHNLPLVWV